MATLVLTTDKAKGKGPGRRSSQHAHMALPTRDELLAHVEFRFRELAPDAPIKLDPNDPAHQTMIRQWHQAHHEMLSKLTDEVFFWYYSRAPKPLDPANAEHATYIEYWKDIAEQIDGRPGATTGRTAASSTTSATAGTAGGASGVRARKRSRCRSRTDRCSSRSSVGYVRTMMDFYAEAVAATPLAAKLIDHTWKQVEALRGSVKDGTFNSYDHWWRSSSYSEAIYDEDDRTEELAFVRDLTLEAKIDRTTACSITHLAGWATDFKKHNTFGRIQPGHRLRRRLLGGASTPTQGRPPSFRAAVTDGRGMAGGSPLSHRPPRAVQLVDLGAGELRHVELHVVADAELDVGEMAVAGGSVARRS